MIFKKLITISEASDWQIKINNFADDKDVAKLKKMYRELAKKNNIGWEGFMKSLFVENFEQIYSSEINYIKRANNLKALHKAVQLLAQIRKENIAPEKIADFIKQQTKKDQTIQSFKFTWDGINKQIIIDCGCVGGNNHHLSL